VFLGQQLVYGRAAFLAKQVIERDVDCRNRLRERFALEVRPAEQVVGSRDLLDEFAFERRRDRAVDHVGERSLGVLLEELPHRRTAGAGGRESPPSVARLDHDEDEIAFQQAARAAVELPILRWFDR